MDDEPALGADPVDPAGVGPAGLPSMTSGWSSRSRRKLLLVAPPSITTVVSAHRAAQPGQRLVAGAAVGDDLGDHRVEVGRDRVALADAGVDPDARARRAARAARSGRATGAKSRSGSSALSRASTACPFSGGCVALEPAAGRDVQLRLDQVEVGGHLGDRVLDLQPGVDLEEGERPLARVVEELDRAGAAVADRERPAARRTP